MDGQAQGADGRFHRLGARVLLLDQSGTEPRLLMMRGHDPDAPDRCFWFTPGGGLERGESTRAAAVRELAEETGFVLDEHELAGPVWIRTAVFDFASLPYAQREEFFVASLADAERREAADTSWTQQEGETIDEVAWMTRGALAADGREVFPAALLDDWAEIMQWDGVTRDMGVMDE